MSRIRSRSAAALLIVLALGIGEPVLCILHCTVWMPLVAHAEHAAVMQAGAMQHAIPVAPGSLARLTEVESRQKPIRLLDERK